MLPPASVPAKGTEGAKPKRGRLVSNETPLDDFNRLIEGEGDVFRKAVSVVNAWKRLC
jgi:ATP-dependent DNA helicase 2 subunit 2